MKKLFCLFCLFFILVGCTLGNNPTSRVEDMLMKYQMLDNEIDVSYLDLTSDSNLSQGIRDRYVSVINKQYRNLSYEIKDEKIDGDMATVMVQIKVMNYKDAIGKFNKVDYDLEDYHELVLDELDNVKDKVTYTINFSLSKEGDDNWRINTLSSVDKNKLLGIN